MKYKALGLLAAVLLVVGWSWPRPQVVVAAYPYGSGIPPQTTFVATFSGDKGNLSVSSTVLRVLGSSSWTGATTNSANDRIQTVTNCGTSGYVYVATVPVGGSLVGAVSMTNYYQVLGPGEQMSRLVHGNINGVAGTGTDLAVISDGTSVPVHAEEEVYR